MKMEITSLTITENMSMVTITKTPKITLVTMATVTIATVTTEIMTPKRQVSALKITTTMEITLSRVKLAWQPLPSC